MLTDISTISGQRNVPGRTEEHVIHFSSCRNCLSRTPVHNWHRTVLAAIVLVGQIASSKRVASRIFVASDERASSYWPCAVQRSRGRKSFLARS